MESHVRYELKTDTVTEHVETILSTTVWKDMDKSWRSVCIAYGVEMADSIEALSQFLSHELGIRSAQISYLIQPKARPSYRAKHEHIFTDNILVTVKIHGVYY